MANISGAVCFLKREKERVHLHFAAGVKRDSAVLLIAGT